MPECKRCQKVFRGPYELKRHLQRKNQCIESECNDHVSSETKMNQLIALATERTNELKNPKECIYCRFVFTQTCNARRHEQHCKENDAVRNLEIKLDITLDKYHEKDCRFCKKVFRRRCDMFVHRKSCKVRAQYHAILEEENKEKHCKTVSNVTVNNNVTNVTNITNNVIINSTSKTDRIMRNLPEEIARWLLHDQRQKSGKHLEWQTGLKMILRTHEKPENRNLKVTSARADTVYCFNGEKDVQRPTEMVIEEEFMECLDDLLHIKKKHEQVLSRIGVMRELENYIDVVWTRDHAFRHKKAVMTGLKCQSVD